MRIARAGARQRGLYGAEVTGISNVSLRGLRKVHAAATRITCAASSTTAKLAIGGDRYVEAGRALLDTGLPFFRAFATVWDNLSMRAGFVTMWWRAVHDIDEHGSE